MATTRKRTSNRGAAEKRAQAALEQLNESLDSAQKALTALRGDLAAGRRDLARDVERMVGSAREDATKLSRAVRADLAEFQGSITKHRKAEQAPRKRATASKAKGKPATASTR